MKIDCAHIFSDRYEVSEQTTRKPSNIQGDEFYGNTNILGGGNGVGDVGVGNGNRLGFIGPNGVT